MTIDQIEAARVTFLEAFSTLSGDALREMIAEPYRSMREADLLVAA